VKLLDTGDVAAAWGGIASVQFGLPVVWTAARGRGVALTEVLRWMSSGPADLVGLTGKGRIAVGGDADLVVLADHESFDVTTEIIRHRHPVTAYLGRRLTGVVRRRWLGGRGWDADAPAGRLLAASR
jgi:allantoinase